VTGKRVSEMSDAEIRELAAARPGDVLGGQAPEPDDGEDLDDGTEPYCTACGEWAALFIGVDGWRHFRGDPAPGGDRTLYEADHEPVIGWTVPPGRGLSPAGAATLGQALGDAIAYRDPAGDCTGCEAHPAGLCQDHAEDLDKADAYIELAGALGIEVER